ncbi:MAG: hypothetical protein ACI4AD_04805 [Roseburia sp.]
MAYIDTQFMPGSIRKSLVDDYGVKITDKTGESMVFTMNLYGDIMDADTGKILARSNLSHDSMKLDNKMPTSWKPAEYDKAMPEENVGRKRLFVDMDGTLAEFKTVDTLELLYEKGYFLNLAPHENVIAAVKEIITNHPEVEVHILSAYLTDSRYALQEKNEWLDRYLPEIDQAHRIFVPCGSDKKEDIDGGIRSNDFLLDDYTQNLNDWQPPARGIKLLNAINHTRGTWEHDRIRYDRTPTDLADAIISIMRDERQIFDEKIMANEKKPILADHRTGMEISFDFGGWGAVRKFVNDVERAGVDVYEYFRHLRAIYEYEVANNIPKNDRMTEWYDEMDILVAKPWYKENDPSVMDRAEGDRHIPISEASIAARYAEIEREQRGRKIPFAADEEPLVDISNLEYDGHGYLHFTVAADDCELEGLYRIYDPEDGVSMTLESIDNGNLHPIIERQWDRIENALSDATIDCYNNRSTLTRNLYDGRDFKIQPMENGQGFLVCSDSEHFGENKIVYQGVNYDECLQYISDRVENIKPSYYVIKDLAGWISGGRGIPPESKVEEFDTVEEAIAKFNEYKGMDYLKQEVIDPRTDEPATRLVLGVYCPSLQEADADILHVKRDKTLLQPYAIAEGPNGYEGLMTNSNFIRDLNKITANIQIDEYSYFRKVTLDELAAHRMAFLKEMYPEETHTREEALRYVSQYPDDTKNYLVKDRVAFADFTPPFLNKDNVPTMENISAANDSLLNTHRRRGR